MKLYKAQDLAPQVDDDEFIDDYILLAEAMPSTEEEGAPEGWDAYCLEKWGEPREFFFPSDRKIYRSRSAAQARVDLINRWGGAAELVEAEVNWVPVVEANRLRKRDRMLAAIERKNAEVGKLYEKLRDL